MPIVSKLQPKGSEDIYDIVDRVSDYSAFEVMPNAEAIAKGSTDTVTGLSYNNEVPACTVHKVRILSDVRIFDEDNDHYNDVIIDWGDGTVEAIRDGIYAYDDSPGGYLATHDYADALAKLGVSSSTFIVKIFGKDYCTFRHNEVKANNLLSRIFDVDLPIASHITNLASTAIGAKRLLKVQIPFATKYISTASNIASAFEECINLKSVKGFAKSIIRDNCTTTSLFRLAKSLEETDFVFPRNSDSLHTTFYHTYRLKTNIEDHFPKGGFSSSHITLSGTFTSSAVKGTVPADILWDSEKTWTITTASNEKAFTGAPNVRAQVPTSWGGTNESIEQSLKLRKHLSDLEIDTTDYTAFEVYAHNEDIPLGYSEELGGEVYYPIPASKTHIICLRSTFQQADIADEEVWKKSDVIIDWGDGNITAVSDGGHTKFDVNTGDLEISAEYQHTYESQGKYIVRVYGKNYFCIGVAADRSYPTATEKNEFYAKNNLVCRVMDKDLPIASHVTNLSGFAQRSLRLLNVKVPSCYKFPEFENAAGLFGQSWNLKTIKGFKNRLFYKASLDDCCAGCSSLTTSDLMIPCVLSRGSAKGFYDGCGMLETAFNELFHSAGMLNKTLNVKWMFRGCGAKTENNTTNVDKLAKLLWNNLDVEFTNTSSAFTSCSDELRAQVPVSWGGTLPDSEIKKPYDVRIQELAARIAELESKLV